MDVNLEITTDRVGSIWYIRIKGELTRSAEEMFLGTFPWLHSQADVRDILFDMSRLEYLNSAGIALLIRFVREANQRNLCTSAQGVSAHYRKIFKIVGLTSYIELFLDEMTALETLRERSRFER